MKINLRSILTSSTDFQYFLINFDRDIFIQNSRKLISDEFRNFIDTEEIEECTEQVEKCKEILEREFFHKSKYQRQGEEISFNMKKERIGHLVLKERLSFELLAIINKNIHSSFFSYDFNDINKFFDKDGYDLNEINRKLGHLQIRLWQMWCFTNDLQMSSVIDGLRINDLPNLLGLDDESLKKEMVLFEIKKPSHARAYNPTFFDAGFKAKWIPGGKTSPDGKTEGLNEVIIEKLEFNQVVFLHIFKN